jgi:hypothetical protein
VRVERCSGVGARNEKPVVLPVGCRGLYRVGSCEACSTRIVSCVRSWPLGLKASLLLTSNFAMVNLVSEKKPSLKRWIAAQ